MKTLPSEIKYLQKNKTSKFDVIKGTKIYKDFKTAAYSILANYQNVVRRDLFEDVNTFCVFIGHGRSGHSIFGALLDAHPNIIISDEANTAKFLQAGFNRTKLFHTLLMKSRRQAKRKRMKRGLGEKVYSYWVPGQWQGRYKKINVIGDSSAGLTIRAFIQNPSLIDQLRDTVKCNLKFIQVVRNPYDNISTIALRGNSRLEEPIERYFNVNCRALKEIRAQINPADLITIHHKDIIDQPKETLKHLIQFIGLKTDEEYLESCASIIFKSSSKTRYKIAWNAELKEKVKKNIEDYDFLSGYSYLDEV